MIWICWGLALLFAGMVLGILSCMFDVLVLGSASFVGNVTLWVLLCTLVATHLKSRNRAMVWSVPIAFGYIEAYYIATSASYEGFARSLMAPLALMSLIAPLLVFGLWQVREVRGIYGWLVSIATSAASVWVSHQVTGAVSPFAVVCALIIWLLLAVLPTRRLSITPTAHPVTEPGASTEFDRELIARAERERRRDEAWLGRHQRLEVDAEAVPSEYVAPVAEPAPAAEVARMRRPAASAGEDRAARTTRGKRPTKRTREQRQTRTTTPTSRNRRQQERERASERSRRRDLTNRGESSQSHPVEQSRPQGFSTLGTTRQATRSRRETSY